ncbi:TonB-dependent receptor [Bordetella genomosp. 7]|uniref:TonB-dependent receptor n=1 Tax=Bordetella genomosp. 7 TaxID=1416805 RepID=A0A261RRT6_9BORD|nr:TonB-dependent receptor [Bordetella genomosp. 7]OZI27392.1 TonB-dependent receptor [Bordetella genomosp. 7]OZI29517.1 TonB-dependent receptor [Bordetella genomosp. 7]
MKSRLLRRAAGVMCAAPAMAAAQQSPSAPPSITQLDPVTVTASRVPLQARDQPVQVSVLTAEQIRTSSAVTVQELLSTQAGIHVINSTGAAEQAAVDIRGFGLTGHSNTLILIDGIPQNNNDLSTPGLGTVPLQRIERIEIVRGSGSVQYGGGATGGVINIVTRRGNADGQPVAASATGTVGSYGLHQLDAAIGLQNEHVTVDVYGQTLRTDNYRDNNRESRDSGGVSLGFAHDSGQVRLYARTTRQKLGLPGPRRVDPATGLNEYEDDPRGTSTPDDYIKTQTDAFGVQVEQQAGAGTLYAELGQRDKSLHGFTGSPFGDTTRTQDLDQTTGSLRYHLPVAGRHALIAGVDMLESNLDATNAYSFSPVPDRWRAEQRQHGVFGEVQLQATDTTRITLGGRRQYARDRLETVSGFSGNSDETRHLGAWQLAMRQEIGNGYAAYGKIGRSFRLANSDEALYVATPLKPQTSVDKELGILWQDGQSSARLTWFRYDLDNEIQYNPVTFSNVNLSPTRRQGVELEGRHALTRELALDANVTWLQAQFRSGTYNGVDLAGNTVPLVPKWMANLGATWRPDERLFVSVAAQYVGKARMDNDQANQFDKQLDDYVLVNGKVGYAFTRHISATLAVNNLFDREYATYGIRSGSTGASGPYNLYPAAGRNVQAALTIRY